MTKLITSIILTLIFTNIFSQNDTVKIKEIEISSSRVPIIYNESTRVISIISREELSNMPVQTLDNVLKYALNTDVRQRGDNGVQSDISIRGGSIDQTLILINGVKVNDPQTGHHNMNLPIDINDIERIEILEGPGSRVFGPNAFCGAINIITRNSADDNIRVTTIAGAHNYFAPGVSASYNFKHIKSYISVNEKSSKGYINNTDFNTKNIFFQTTLSTSLANIDVQAGYIDKAFGANSFYTPKYPDQYEQTKTSLLNTRISLNKIMHLTVNVYWRRNFDKFELFRDEHPAWYIGHNYHRTDVIGAELNSYFISKLGKTAFGLELRDEKILSNVLGNTMMSNIEVLFEKDAFYTKDKKRENQSAFIEHVYNYRKFTCSAGLLAERSNDYKLHYYPGIDLSFDFNSYFKLFGSINKSSRLPTFTDLYYQGPTNTGNPDLKPEEAIAYETGLKYFSKLLNAHIAVFRRDGKNIIDWVKLPGANKWSSMNLTELQTDGIEFAADFNMKSLHWYNFPVKNISLNYSYINTAKNAGDYISYYALDYMKHKASITLYHKIYRNFNASWSYSYNFRNGTYTEFPGGNEVRYKPYSLLDGRINWKNKNINVYLEASNILNKQYIDFGNIYMPGIWLKTGIILELNRQ